MARLSRVESRALTRERLLSAAYDLFGREGYASVSVERIAEIAGYSKGAVYSNFEGKEAIFLTVLEQAARASLDDLLAGLRHAASPAEAVARLADWADARSQSGGWALTVLEHARSAPGSASVRRQEEILRANWRQLGDGLIARFPHLGGDGETLGALLHEIAFAPAMSFVAKPTAGELMRVAAAALLRPA